MHAPDGTPEQEPGARESSPASDASDLRAQLLAGERIELPEPAATRQLAELLAGHLESGALLLLDGPLGAGKTTLVQGIVAALGSSAAVTSPTYTLVHEYPSPQGTIVHIDAYRLPSPETLQELGLDDYLDRARLVAVEWGRPLLEAYPGAAVLVLERADRGRRARLIAPDADSSR